MRIAIFVVVLSLGIYFLKTSMQNKLKPSGTSPKVSLESGNEYSRKFNKTYFDPRKKELKLFTLEGVEIPLHPETDTALITAFSKLALFYYKKLETSGSTKYRVSFDKDLKIIYPVSITGEIKTHNGKPHYLLESLKFMKKNELEITNEH